ncbi:MCE family protein [Nocardioides sp.]|uniref:MCE family protein n=1 Tax=Nocardioides sp. TaxID=35761 RepID=UPI0027344DD4|nr:MCE family protein [Nocardioides sp.]MDP3892924.1 MCE family protein [Nocardioides sp.]
MTVTRHLNVRTAVAAVVVILLAATLYAVRDDSDTRVVTAHFSRAVSVYPGTDVRILGVSVGTVLEVVPDGESVRVRMEYDADQKLPADAKAVVVTPTLVADRFVQLTPAYTGGPELDDGAVIERPDTGVPVELDRIYASLKDLSEALGPNGVNKTGTLDHLLEVGADSLGGKGELGNTMIRDLADAAETFGDGSGALFATVRELAEFTEVLAENDELVRAFITDLAGMSAVLAEERTELELVLAEVARTVGVVESFVKDNREALVTDVEKLTRVVKNVASEKESLAKSLRYGPLGIGNLTLAYNAQTGTIGSRIGVEGNIADVDGFLCSIVAQSQVPKAARDLACQLFEQLLEPAVAGTGQRPATAGPAVDAQKTQARYSDSTDASLSGLLGGGDR